MKNKKNKLENLNTNQDENLEDSLIVEEEDEEVNDEIKVEEGKEPLFPFDKMPYQEKAENVNDVLDYEMGDNQELSLGENEKRLKRRTLKEERGSGHEP